MKVELINPEPTVQIELTKNEAILLKKLFGSVGGGYNGPLYLANITVETKEMRLLTNGLYREFGKVNV